MHIHAKWHKDYDAWEKSGRTTGYPRSSSWPGRESAAVKRASMDLSRALADLRQGRKGEEGR
jgi:hypothetical protein